MTENAKMQEKGKNKTVSDTEKINQLVTDLLFNILRDWVHISAGQNRKGTNNLSPSNLQKVLSNIEVKRMEALVRGHVYGGLYRSQSTQKKGSKWRKTFKSSFLNPVLQAADNSWIGVYQNVLPDQAETPGSSETVQSEGANGRNLTAQTPGKALLASEIHPSRLPLSSRPGQTSVVFLSQLIPAKFNCNDRPQLLNVLRSRGSFIPTCIVGKREPLIQIYFGNLIANVDRLARLAEYTAQYLSMSSSQTSPSPDGVGLKDLPIEVLDNIAQYLVRKDVQSLLSTCKKINDRVGPSYFRHVVLPFDADTFQCFQSSKSKGHPNDDQEPPTAKLPKVQEVTSIHRSNESRTELSEAKPSQIQATPTEEGPITSAQTSNSKLPSHEPDISLNMFRTWGAHVTKFAFALEFNQDELLTAKERPTCFKYESFYPTETDIYWPINYYIASLGNQKREAEAAQTEMMGWTLSKLTKVEELALSVDSGLGWIYGQDKSDRASFFEDKIEVFGRRFDRSKAEYAREWFDANEALLSYFTGIDREMLELYSECIRLSFLANSNLLSIIADFMKTFPRQELIYLNDDEIDDHIRLAMIAAGYLKPEQDVYMWHMKELILELAGCLFWIDQVRLREFWWMSEIQGSRFSKFHVPNTRGLFIPIALPSNKDQFVSNIQNLSHWTTWPIDFRCLPRVHYDNEDGKPEEVNGDAVSDPKDKSDFPCEGSKESVSDSDDHLPNTMETVRIFDRSFLLRLSQAEQNNEEALIFNGIDLADNQTRPFAFRYGTNLPWPPIASLNRIIEEEINFGSLKPNNLTLAQRQCLKETGWVHQTFFTSYITSIIDHKADFSTVRTFTLAKLSSSYLGHLQSPNFWRALANLTQVTIMVSPDWREIKLSYDDSFPASDIFPSKAATQLYKIMVVISKRPLVKTLKVGYIGGGEHASGLWARNAHLLPAPLTDDSYPGQIVIFPELENLTLVNCWIVPSVLKKFVISMTARSLRTLTLTSVSLLLYGGDTDEAPTHLGQEVRGYGVKNDLIKPAEMTRELVRPDPPAQDGHPLPVVLCNQYIYKDTWPDFIDVTDPAQTLEMMMASHYIDELPEPPTGRLNRIEFISCGYAYLPVAQRFEYPYDIPEGFIQSNSLRQRKIELGKHVMLTLDWFLGQIVPFLGEYDELLLKHALGMTLGWGNDPRRLHACEDGWPEGGTGRFSGVLERKTWTRAEM